MLCSNCKRKEAEVFIEESSRTKSVKVALCRECAEKTSRFSSFTRSVFSDSEPLFIKSDLPESSESCPLCSMTLKEIQRTKKAGCAKCYTTFAPEFYYAITLIHGSAVHTGRAPKLFAENAAKKRRLSLLRAELKVEMENENFEKCVLLRDEINKIQNGDEI